MLSRQEYLKRVGFTLLILAGLGLLYLGQSIVLSLLMAVGLATLLNPIIDFICEHIKVKRAFAAIMTYLLLLGIFFTSFFILFKISDGHVLKILDELPDHLSKADKIIKGFLRDYFNVKEIKFFNFDDKGLKSISKKVFVGIKVSTKYLSYGALSLIMAFYFSLNSNFYLKNFTKIISNENQEKVTETLQTLASALREWMKAQAIDMVFVSLLTMIGLKIVGVELWLSFGLLSGLFSIIPYLGVLMVAALTCLSVLAQQPDLFFWVILVFFITQQIEGNLILPYFMKSKVLIPEVVLIATLSLMWICLGIVGAIITAPLLAVVIAYINLDRPESKKLFK